MTDRSVKPVPACPFPSRGNPGMTKFSMPTTRKTQKGGRSSELAVPASSMSLPQSPRSAWIIQGQARQFRIPDSAARPSMASMIAFHNVNCYDQGPGRCAGKTKKIERGEDKGQGISGFQTRHTSLAIMTGRNECRPTRFLVRLNHPCLRYSFYFFSGS